MKVLVFLAVACSATTADLQGLKADSAFVQVMTGFIAGLQRDPTHLSSCQTLVPSLETSWGKAADSIITGAAWDSLYNLRDFFTALDFWTQTCNFTTLLNYIKINITWNLLLTRIFTNLTFYMNAWDTMVASYSAGSYLEAGKELGQLISKTIGFNLN